MNSTKCANFEVPESRSASPISIARQSTDMRHLKNCAVPSRKDDLVNCQSSSIDLNCISHGSSERKMPTRKYSGFGRRSFSRENAFFVQITDDECDFGSCASSSSSCSVSVWAPMSPSDSAASSPEKILRGQYRARFFEESGLLPIDVSSSTSSPGKL